MWVHLNACFHCASAYDAAVDPTLHRDEKRQRVQNAMVICLLLHFGAQVQWFHFGTHGTHGTHNLLVQSSVAWSVELL